MGLNVLANHGLGIAEAANEPALSSNRTCLLPSGKTSDFSKAVGILHVSSGHMFSCRNFTDLALHQIVNGACLSLKPKRYRNIEFDERAQCSDTSSYAAGTEPQGVGGCMPKEMWGALQFLLSGIVP